MIEFDLDAAIDDISESLGQPYTNVSNSEFSKEYTLPNVEEEDLLGLGFEFKGYSQIAEYPYYEWNNLMAVYIGDVLHICQLGR